MVLISFGEEFNENCNNIPKSMFFFFVINYLFYNFHLFNILDVLGIQGNGDRRLIIKLIYKLIKNMIFIECYPHDITQGHDYVSWSNNNDYSIFAKHLCRVTSPVVEQTPVNEYFFNKNR